MTNQGGDQAFDERIISVNLFALIEITQVLALDTTNYVLLVGLLFLRSLFLQLEQLEKSNGESEVDTEAPSRVASMQGFCQQ